MASVFLSYDHDDAFKARPIAIALEKAGHSVWWDQHVRGGTQYSKVIEDALKAADVVVVLWSAHSVESPWVRDEAAAGRDGGRLVPVALDRTEPPLGFRQFQTIDLSRWKGRGTVPRLPEILQSIDAMLGKEVEPVRAAPSATVWRGFARPRLAAITALVIAVIAIAYFLVNRTGKSDLHTVAIVAADQSAKPLAQDLLVELSTLPSVQAGTIQLIGNATRNKVDLIFEAGSGRAGKSAVTLMLLNAKDRAIFWSKEFDRGTDGQADLKDRMAYAAAGVLGCAVEGLEPGSEALNDQTMKLYLTGCTQLAEASDESRSQVVQALEQVVKQAPRFEAGWGKLLRAESDAVAEDRNRDRAALRRYIAQARQLNPDMAETTLAEVTLLPTNAFGEALRLLDGAKKRHPDNALVLGFRSHALANVGRMSEAVEDAREAARLEPTEPDALNNYVMTLAYAGRVDAARLEFERAERLWSGTGRLAEMQYAFQLRFGDPKEMLNSARFREGNPRMRLYYRTRADPTPANVDRFMAFLRGLYDRRGLTLDDVVGHSQAYGELHREDDLYQLISRLPPGADLSPLARVIFRPVFHKFRHDPRFMAVAKRAGLVDYWTKSGKWPDFCFDPDQPYDCKAEAAKLG